MTGAEREEWEGILRWMEVPDVEVCRAAGCPAEPIRCFCWDACAPPDDDESPAGPRGACDCPVRPPPPCRHIRSRDHGLPVDKWAALLAEVWPDEYAERPRAETPVMVLSREARVAILETRQAAGEALWHPGDLMPEDVEHLGQAVRLTEGNFQPRSAGLVVLGEAA